MIQTSFIKENEQIIAVILDYEEYQRLKAIEEDYKDYCEAVEVKQTNTKWIRHDDLKKELGL